MYFTRLEQYTIGKAIRFIIHPHISAKAHNYNFH
jgi:hypothetical protein